MAIDSTKFGIVNFCLSLCIHYSTTVYYTHSDHTSKQCLIWLKWKALDLASAVGLYNSTQANTLEAIAREELIHILQAMFSFTGK